MTLLGRGKRIVNASELSSSCASPFGEPQGDLHRSPPRAAVRHFRHQHLNHCPDIPAPIHGIWQFHSIKPAFDKSLCRNGDGIISSASGMKSYVDLSVPRIGSSKFITERLFDPLAGDHQKRRLQRDEIIIGAEVRWRQLGQQLTHVTIQHHKLSGCRYDCVAPGLRERGRRC